MNSTGSTRRTVLRGLAAAPVLLGGRYVSAQSESAAAPALEYPKQPMRLARVLTRDLRGGAVLQVARDWQVKFAPQGRGVAITGAQLSARVDAPPALAQMAAIEQQRETGDMFPILLSDGGIILAAGSSMRDVDLNYAVLKAQTILAQTRIPDDEKAQHSLFLAQLQRSGASLLDQMPPDLFFPGGTPVRSTREISLPGGLIGEFEMRYDAFTRAGAPWLHRALREVITRIGGEARRSVEEWTLETLSDAGR